MTILSSASSMAMRRAWLWKNRNDFSASRGVHRTQLLVDVSGIIHHDARTGIQRAVRALWLHLKEREGERFDVLPVYASNSHGYCYAPADFLTCKNEAGQHPVRIAAGDKFLGLDLAAHLLPKYRAQIRAWRNEGGRVHLMVYDLLPLLRPEWFTEANVRHFRKWYSVLQTDVDQAICISGEVARQLRQRLHQSDRQAPPVTHIPMGSDVESSLPTTGLSPAVSAVLEKARRKPAILMVGTIEPRKAYDVALRAFDVLWSKRGNCAPDLVIVGKPGWKTSELQRKIRGHEEHGRRLHWLDNVSDEGLSQLYGTCMGLLMASHAEGFGLPLTEAAKHDRPVLARDLPVFREQELPNVRFFRDDSPELLGEAILELALADPTPMLRKTRLPTWSDSVDVLLERLGMDGPEVFQSSNRLAAGRAEAARNQ